jgi:site-specific DNA-methyltransferase (adenine-specific)
MDCLEGMKLIDDKSIDMILCDLPYGTTACKWDTIIPFEPLWDQYERIIKNNGAIVLTASQPFTSALIMSNPKMFKYEIIWDKVNRYTGHVRANKMPLKRHENICIFYKSQPIYNKQYRQGKPYLMTRNSKSNGKHNSNEQYKRIITNNIGQYNPCSILEIKADIKKEMGLHPTQKPAELFEYLIRTYSNENELVLDNCMGSGTTAIAAINTNRNYIGFELDATYCGLANKRIQDIVSEGR